MAIYRSGQRGSDRRDYGGRWARAFVRNSLRVAKEAASIFRWDGSKWIRIFGGQTVNPPTVHDESHSSTLSAYGEPWELGGGSGVADRSVESSLVAYGIPWALPADRTHLPDSLLRAYGVPWEFGQYRHRTEEPTSELVAVGTPWNTASPMTFVPGAINTRAGVEGNVELPLLFRNGVEPYHSFSIVTDIPGGLAIEEDRYLVWTPNETLGVNQPFVAAVRGYDSTRPVQKSAVALITCRRTPDPEEVPVIEGPDSVIWTSRGFTRRRRDDDTRIAITCILDEDDGGSLGDFVLEADGSGAVMTTLAPHNVHVGTSTARYYWIQMSSLPEGAFVGQSWNLVVSGYYTDKHGYQSKITKRIRIRYVVDEPVIRVWRGRIGNRFTPRRYFDTELPAEPGETTTYNIDGSIPNSVIDATSITYLIDSVGDSRVAVSPLRRTDGSPGGEVDSSFDITPTASIPRGTRIPISGRVIFNGGNVNGLVGEWRRTIVIPCLEKRIIVDGVPYVGAGIDVPSQENEYGEAGFSFVGGCPGTTVEGVSLANEESTRHAGDARWRIELIDGKVRCTVLHIPPSGRPGEITQGNIFVRIDLIMMLSDGTSVERTVAFKWTRSRSPDLSAPDFDIFPRQERTIRPTIDWHGAPSELLNLSLENASSKPDWLSTFEVASDKRSFDVERTNDTTVFDESFDYVLRHTYRTPSNYGGRPYIEKTGTIRAVLRPISIADRTISGVRARNVVKYFPITGGTETYSEVEVQFGEAMRELYLRRFRGVPFMNVEGSIHNNQLRLRAFCFLAATPGRYPFAVRIIDSLGNRSHSLPMTYVVLTPPQRRFYSFGDNISVSVSDSFG